MKKGHLIKGEVIESDQPPGYFFGVDIEFIQLCVKGLLVLFLKMKEGGHKNAVLIVLQKFTRNHRFRTEPEIDPGCRDPEALIFFHQLTEKVLVALFNIEIELLSKHLPDLRLKVMRYPRLHDIEEFQDA